MLKPFLTRIFIKGEGVKLISEEVNYDKAKLLTIVSRRVHIHKPP